MVSEGTEYTVVLRTDASSQVATLSTSIQAIMLLARMLDPPQRPVSNGRFGSRAIVFTDDLDVSVDSSRFIAAGPLPRRELEPGQWIATIGARVLRQACCPQKFAFTVL